MMATAELYRYDHAPLQDGDQMDQPAFHALYEASGPQFRAELIGGTVHLMTPVSDEHSAPHTVIVLWLGEFGMAAPGTVVRIDPTVILGPRSEP
ncbi:MAG: Uma2 family endonuclease, partial [Chloroflexi bacterium]|nr:Uma2 family endonuclease [Chloroflexota bacterium]